MWKRLSLAVLIAGLCGSVMAQDATSEPPVQAAAGPSGQVVGGDESALRAFLLHLLTVSSPDQNVTALIGALPSDLPFAFSIPASALLYGTIVRPGNIPDSQSYEIAFSTSAPEQTPEAILAFYKQAFAAPDWSVTSESSSEASGFGQQASAYATLCFQQGAAGATLSTASDGQHPTETTLFIQVPADPYLCTPVDQATPQPVYAIIPPLALPQGVTLIANMGGSGLSYYKPDGVSNSANAVLDTSLTPEELANAYNAQLAAAGWQAVSSSATDQTAFSTWRITDAAGKTWQGALLIVADSLPNRYNALIYVTE